MILSLVIASEAKQSSSEQDSGLLRRYAPRNDDVHVQFTILTGSERMPRMKFE
jgi:hypothetical protein